MTLNDIKDALLIIKSHNPTLQPFIDFTEDCSEVELTMPIKDDFVRTDLWKELQHFCMTIIPGTPSVLHIGGKLYSDEQCKHDEVMCVNCGIPVRVQA